MAARDTHRNVVILGGGFAGAFSAWYLRRVLSRDVSVELICDRNYFVFQPLLPEVAAGTINALVVALGQTTDLSHTPGFAEHSMTMRDLADAYRLRNHVVQCLENADITDDAGLKRRLLTFVVASGGFSGSYEDFVRIVGEGDRWGERSLVEGCKTQGTLTAVEDTRVLVIPQHDFLKIRGSLEVVDNYFKRIPDKIHPPGIRARRPDGE